MRKYKIKKSIFVVYIFLLLIIVACSQQTTTLPNQQTNEVAQPGETKTVTEPSVPANSQETQNTEKIAQETDNQNTAQETQTQEQNPATQPETASDTVEMDVTAKQFEFVPSTIKVKQGQKVILHIKSLDVTHGFALPDYKINAYLEPGKEVTVEFVADKKGTFTFFCSVPCGSGHRSMKGTLVVE